MYSEQALSWALARLNLTYYVVLPSLVNGSITSENQNQKEKYFPPPGGVRGWVRGYGGVGLWEAGPECACCEDYDWESSRVWGFWLFLFDFT